MRCQIKLCLLLLATLLIACSCAHSIDDAAISTLRPENTAVISPTPALSSRLAISESDLDSNAYPSIWKQDDIYTAWISSDKGNILSNMGSVPEPASVTQMLPLIELVLSHRTVYDFYHDDLRHALPFDGNENDAGNELYIWGLMYNLFSTYGTEHPETIKYPQNDHPNMLLIPQQAAKDFLWPALVNIMEIKPCLLRRPLAGARPR